MNSPESSKSKGGRKFTRSGTRREGDDFQDVVAINLLLQWLGSNHEYEWFKVEADDALFLDDVTAKRSDGSYVYRQVKYSAHPEDSDDAWDFEKLVARKPGIGGKTGSSLLEKWARSLAGLSRRGKTIDAAVISNRKPADAMRRALVDGFVEFDRIDSGHRASIVSQLCGESEAREFFRSFRFELDYPGLMELEGGCKRRFRLLGGNEEGWLSLKQTVGIWVCRHDEPRKGGRIYLPDIYHAARWYGLRPVSQAFYVPDDYVAPLVEFRDAFEKVLLGGSHRCVVLTGSPGSGKSTFASELYSSLRRRGIPVIRHHYYLPTPGDYTTYQRADHRLAAESFMHDLLHDYPDLLGELVTRNPAPSPDELKSWLGEAGKNCEKKKLRLLVILDGLDHVWAERQSAEELKKLLGPLLPPPDGVTVLLVTQRVSDDRLPPKILELAPRDSWIGLPLFDTLATTKWLRSYLRSRGPGARRSTNERRRSEFVEALQQHSGGHPLHLRYTLGALVERDLPLTEQSLARLPACASADISAYYRALWNGLSQNARELLHLVAACGFPWPRNGMSECLELMGNARSNAQAATREVSHLLVEGPGGVRPYHASLLAFVRDEADHVENRKGLLDAALRWLKERAPEFWRWAFSMQLEADLGNYRPLVDSLDRAWLVDSIAKLRPAHLVQDQLSRALWHAADQGDLDSVVKIALLCDYTTDAFERHNEIVASFVPALLAADASGEIAVSLQRSLDGLHHEALQSLAEHAAGLGDKSLTRRCFSTLRERASNLRGKRIAVHGESEELTRAALAVGALDGAREVDDIISVALRNRESGHAGQILEIAARELREVDDGKRLRALLEQSLRPGSSGSEQFSAPELSLLIREAALHALEKGWQIPAASLPATDHPMIAIYAAIRTGSHIAESEPVFPEWIEPKDRYFQYNERMDRQQEFFRASFHAFLANHLLNHPERNRAWLATRENDSWMDIFLARLDQVAHECATSLSKKESRPHRWLFDAVASVSRPVFRGNQNLDEYQLSTCAVRAVMELAFDLAAVRAGCGLAETVTEEDLRGLNESGYCFFSDWLGRYGRLGRAWMSPSMWKAFCDRQEQSLVSSLTSLPDRARELAKLARVAAVQRHPADAERLIRLAAESLVAHGDHKDMLLHDLLLSVKALFEGLPREGWPRAEQLQSWLKLLVPPIVFVGKYTDGDETSHLPSELATTLGLIAPELLPSYYRWLAGEDEDDDTSHAFAAYVKVANLSDPFVHAIAQTAVGPESRLVLEERAQTGDAGAKTALEKIESVLGRMPKVVRTEDTTTNNSSSFARGDQPLPTPDQHPPEKLEELLRVLETRYVERKELLARWADHWEATGAEREVLEAFERAYERGELIAAPAVPYRIATKLGDRDAAFRWLVRDNRESSGWYWMSASEETSATRWEEVRRAFAENWLVFLRDTIRRYGYPVSQTEPWKGTSFGHGGFSRLLKYCLALGKSEVATQLLDSIVRNTVEYVRPLKFPAVRWVEEGVERSDERTRHLDFLLARLTWPSALVRERASDAIGELLANGEHGEFVQTRLAVWMNEQALESHSILGLLAYCRAKEEYGAVICSEIPISKPSVLSNTILAETFPDISFAALNEAHSGDAPHTFVPDRFFEKYARNFLPPLFLHRARRVERVGPRGFYKQWAYEWSTLEDRLKIPLTTAPLDYWLGSSSYKEPTRAADPAMSELFRSAYLRAISWAADRGHMPPVGARFLAAETCPVDLGLWRIRPQRRPAWWPWFNSPVGKIDDMPARLLASIASLRAAEQNDNPPWGSSWSLAYAVGRVSDEDSIYDVEISSFLQSCCGPESPQPHDVWKHLSEDVMFGQGGVAAKSSDVSFDGSIEPVDFEDALQQIGDWIVLRLAGCSWACYPQRWQWWRLHRPVWLPFVYSGDDLVRFLPEDHSVVVRRGDDIISRWQDWTDGIDEKLNQKLNPASGSSLLLRRSEVAELESRTGMVPAWAVRITCFHRDGRHEEFSAHVIHQILGGTTIVRPDWQTG